LLAAAALAFCFLALAAEGPVPGPVDESPERRLQRVREEVARLSAERERLAQDTAGVLARLDALAAEARFQDARIEELTLERAEAEAALAATTARRAAAQERLDAGRARLATIARLLQQAGPLGRIKPVLGAADADALGAGLRTTHELAWRYKGEVAGIQDNEARLAALEADQRAKQAEVTRLRDEALAARGALEASIRARQDLLADMRQQAAVRDEAVVELERARGSLESVIAGAPDAAPVRLDARRFKGLFRVPVEDGKVDEPFGDRVDPRFGTRLPHPGWDLAAPFGAVVRAPFDARVAWSGWLKGYGLVVVLDHGSAVHTVYGHLSAAIVQAGDPIGQGESLGRVGDTGSVRGPYLYLEVRVDGRPEDPASWFGKLAP
jgi:septal ring factor EnvC (AmiA/AmiB activator)